MDSAGTDKRERKGKGLRKGRCRGALSRAKGGTDLNALQTSK